jgi:hypothetical protein
LLPAAKLDIGVDADVAILLYDRPAISTVALDAERLLDETTLGTPLKDNNEYPPSAFTPPPSLPNDKGHHERSCEENLCFEHLL